MACESLKLFLNSFNIFLWFKGILTVIESYYTRAV